MQRHVYLQPWIFTINVSNYNIYALYYCVYIVCVYMYMCICSVCMCVYMCICMYVCICCVYVYIIIYIYIDIYKRSKVEAAST